MIKKISFIFICFIVVLFGLYYINLSNFNDEELSKRVAFKKVRHINTPQTEEFVEVDIYLDDYNEKKEVNNDYVARIDINNLFVEDVVQTSDNEYYLSHDFNKQEYSQGSIFMDFRNILDDQNIILYGHYVYKDETAKFGPLHLLKDEQNYDKYKNISIYFKDEIRNYIVSKVYYYVMDSDKLIYFLTNYSDEDLYKYLNEVDKVTFYKTDVIIEPGDRFITLQTCVRNRDDLKLIVIAKEVE